jgi:UDP-glucose 4-epimerase
VAEKRLKAESGVLVTGATGFIGQALCQRISGDGGQLRRALRRGGGQDGVVVGDLGPATDWSAALAGIDCVVHLAARVHVMRDQSIDPLSEFRRVNVESTLNLARQAIAAGVRRLVFISSIKVNGELTQPGCFFGADDIPAPVDPYGVSKHEAEQGLLALASATTGMTVVIIRPPLVYGPGVKANFLTMMRWLYAGVPLPFGAIHNLRSLVGLDNLIDLIVTCLDHPAAANQVFLVSDGEDLSTTEMLQRAAAAMGKPSRLLPVPQDWLTHGLRLLGKRDLAQRLCGSLQVDISKSHELLAWTPPVSVDEGLGKAVDAFLRSMQK